MKAASPRRAAVSWALYDWANSPFATLVVTFVFPAYFASAVVGDPVAGQAEWGYAMGLSGLLVAVTAPVFGAVADTGGRRKRWLAAFTLLCAAASAALWLVRPEAAAVTLAVTLVVLANWGLEAAGVFYNAMLPDIAGPGRMGRLSGWAWGLGYAGGLAALVLALVALVMPETPWFGIPKEGAAHIRLIGPLVAAWLLIFALPLFLWVPEASPAAAPALRVRAALRSLGRSLAEVARMGPTGRFLLAHLLYADGLATLFAMGGVFVAGAHGFTLEEVMLFGIVLNVTAGLGAAGFAWMDDLAGPKPTILVALAGLIAAGAGILLAEQRLLVWVLGGALGIFVGPAQAAGRSLLARLAPPERRTELFGLYALSGKATAFLGPWAVGAVTIASGSQAAGMAVILAFFAAGAAVLATVRPER
ncbi:MFS transporter [Magnetospirillum sp. UT-4]|uniref:MFS transporter n=1 Tax=Magnetospirillum sp. UT-4 TaxID=2681467 RepID=UPI001384C441|nr:MFS transporter [Magnetospirillum sp. UT-4]CAA7623161.1 Major facilitator superfamily MFS_1 [Magnetospirillum sp. UT-4]